jgi:CheY-like chemotaxis protein/two-component sensor histidine kinase
LALINQILELSKVEANAAKLNPEPVDIVQYLKYLLQSFTSLADEKAITLQFETDAAELQTVLDKTKFTLIIQNLVTNAVKFTNSNGIITIRIKAIKNPLEIEVQDTGVGIDSTELPFIFNRFYQANNQQGNFKGTGIGLALTKELVGLLNGNIEVESKRGSGSIFRIRLPIHRQVIKEEVRNRDSKSDNTIEITEEKLSILLIEDNEDVAAVIRDILMERFEVSHAINGREGVEIAIDKIPDIIISDVMMPEMNGLEVTQYLKSDIRTSHIPLILLTAKADLDSKLSGLEQGADVYLAKPFHSKELLLSIQNLIRLRDSLRMRYASGQVITRDSTYPEDKFIVGLQALLYNHLSDDSFGIDEICKGIGISRTQLHRKLKALTGKSASLYIRDLRLAEGKKLLRQNSSTVAEVAYAIGFSDPNYFSRLYSEKYGHSPIEERKK